MTIINDRDSDGGIRCQVVATTDARLLPQLREVLTADASLSVIVSRAVSWSGRGPEVQFRGSRYRLDREVVRVEVTCGEDQVDAVAAAIRRVLGSGSAAGQDEDSIAVHAIHARPGAGAAGQRWMRLRETPAERDADRRSF